MDSDACWLSCEMHQVGTSVPTGLFREDSFYFILYHISLSLSLCRYVSFRSISVFAQVSNDLTSRSDLPTGPLGSVRSSSAPVSGVLPTPAPWWMERACGLIAHSLMPRNTIKGITKRKAFLKEPFPSSCSLRLEAIALSMEALPLFDAVLQRFKGLVRAALDSVFEGLRSSTATTVMFNQCVQRALKALKI